MKSYHGMRMAEGCVVSVDGMTLDPRYDLKKHSDSGFEWGYDGTGPRQLALAILADHLNDDRQALNRHQVFTETVIAELTCDEWTLTSDRIQDSLDQVTVVPMDLKTLLQRVRGYRV